jgi:hypothetical protein
MAQLRRYYCQSSTSKLGAWCTVWGLNRRHRPYASSNRDLLDYELRKRLALLCVQKLGCFAVCAKVGLLRCLSVGGVLSMCQSITCAAAASCCAASVSADTMSVASP